MSKKKPDDFVLKRRDVLKAVAGTVVAGTVAAQPPAGPFDLPAAAFDPKKLDQIPAWAFRTPLPIPPVPRPTFVGTYEQVMAKNAKPFGPTDPAPMGDVFHGIAREWGETPEHWKMFGLDPTKTGKESWQDKKDHFGSFHAYNDTDCSGAPIPNWAGFPIKCYKIPITEFQQSLAHHPIPARMFGYGGMAPGPRHALRLGQPVVIRYENHLEAEVSIHLHGGHSPSHSDGFPAFFVLQGKARDYFYPNILPLKKVTGENPKCTAKVDSRECSPPVTKAGFQVDLGESQSSMWYHDHGMDATGYNVSKGLAGVAKCFGERELKLIAEGILPGLGKDSCQDPDQTKLSKATDLERPDLPGFYQYKKEPYYNPYDLYLVFQDKVIDSLTGQIAFSTAGHNGYLGDTVLVNGEAYPRLEAEYRKYRFRFLDGSNARIYRLRLLSEDDFHRLHDKGIDPVGADPNADGVIAARTKNYDQVAKSFLRIGKDSWLWDKPLLRKSVTIAMANRADIVVDFPALKAGLKEGEEAVFYLVNTMPQFDGRGPKAVLADGGDPRVLPLPFDTVATADGQVPATTVAELARPMPLMKIVVRNDKNSLDNLKKYPDAKICLDTVLNPHDPICDDEVQVVREFTFQRGKGAWMINKRFYDPTIANATPTLGTVEEWVLRNGGGGWWHPIHIHLESHQLISYEKDFLADQVIDAADPPAQPPLNNLVPVHHQMDHTEVIGLHDTQILGPNTVARIRMRFRTWSGPFVFHCHNLEHEDMRMMHNFEPVPRGYLIDPVTDELMRQEANTVPDARTHGDDMTLQDPDPRKPRKVGELPWETYAVPRAPTTDAGEVQIQNRPIPKPLK